MNIQQLAALARTYFVPKQRDGHPIWTRAEHSPDWIETMTYEAHGEMFPDDWRYTFVVEALDTLADHDEVDEARDSLEASIYTHELLDWLNTNTGRIDYVNQAIDEGLTEDLMGYIRYGQLTEREEVFQLVLGFLERHVEEGK